MTLTQQASTGCSCCCCCCLLAWQEPAYDVQHRGSPGGGDPQQGQPLVMRQVEGQPGQQIEEPLLLLLRHNHPAMDQAGHQETWPEEKLSSLKVLVLATVYQMFQHNLKFYIQICVNLVKVSCPFYKGLGRLECCFVLNPYCHINSPLWLKHYDNLVYAFV